MASKVVRAGDFRDLNLLLDSINDLMETATDDLYVEIRELEVKSAGTEQTIGKFVYRGETESIVYKPYEV